MCQLVANQIKAVIEVTNNYYLVLSNLHLLVATALH